MLLALQLNDLLSHLLHLNTVKTSIYFSTKLITSTTFTLQSNDTEIEEEKGRIGGEESREEEDKRRGAEKRGVGEEEESKEQERGREEEGNRRRGGKH